MKAPKTRCVVVLTVGRSGSSALAEILTHLGVDMGVSVECERHHWQHSRWNPRGQYERPATRQFAKRYLENRGGGWSKPDLKGLDEPTEEELKRFSKIVARCSAKSQLWGWKDPRTVLYIKAFAHLLPDPIFIWLGRERRAIVRSMTHRNPGWSRTNCETMHDFYVGKLKEFQIDHEVFVIRYEELVEQPEVHMEKIAGLLGIPPDKKAAGCVVSDLKHF